MAKKITNDSFIESNFLQPTIDKVKEFISVIGDLKDKLKPPYFSNTCFLKKKVVCGGIQPFKKSPSL